MLIALKAMSMAAGLAAIAVAYDREIVAVKPDYSRERQQALDAIAAIANNVVRPVLATERVVLSLDVTRTIMVHGSPPPITQCKISAEAHIYDEAYAPANLKTPVDYGLTDY